MPRTEGPADIPLDATRWRATVHSMAQALVRSSGKADLPKDLTALQVLGFHPFDAEGGDRHGSWVWPWVKRENGNGVAGYVTFALTASEQNDESTYVAAFEGSVEDDLGKEILVPSLTDTRRAVSINSAATENWPSLLLAMFERVQEVITNQAQYRWLVLDNGTEIDLASGELRRGGNLVRTVRGQPHVVLLELSSHVDQWVDLNRIVGPYARQIVYYLRSLIEDYPHSPRYIVNHPNVGYRLQNAKLIVDSRSNGRGVF